MASREEVQRIWKCVDAVCFDVDSTVCPDEAIDELALFCGQGEAVMKLLPMEADISTNEAMKGGLGFKDSLNLRLSIIKPTLEQVRDFVHSRMPTKLTPHIKSLVTRLHQLSVPVYLVSGGFRGVIGPVALALNIPLENIYANRLKFFYNGEYAGFDEEEPTSKTNGKGEVIKLLKAKYGYSNVVMIGDGMTDYEACPPADAYIGYGGNVVREEVKSRAKWYVKDFRDLIQALD